MCLIPNVTENVQYTLRDVSNFVLVPLNMLLASLSLITNLLILTAVVRTRSLQHPSLLLLCSLSVTDLLWAIYSIVVDTARITHEQFCPVGVGAFGQAFSVLCYLATLGNLAVISEDRQLAVNRPLWYRTHVTGSRVAKKASLVWLFSLVMSLLMYLGENFTVIRFPIRFIAVLVYAICIVIMIYSYVRIFIANRRHRQTMDQHTGQILATLKRERRLASTFGLILIVLCLTFLPALIFPLVLATMGFSRADFIPFRPFYALFITLNGLLNPLLYYGRNENVRRAVRGLIKCPKCVGRVQPVTIERSERSQNRSSLETIELEVQSHSLPVLSQRNGNESVG